MSDSRPSKTLSISEGELWSLVRSLISQGTAIQMDAHAGKYPTSEHVFARIDEAARERSDEIVSKYSAHEPKTELPFLRDFDGNPIRQMSQAEYDAMYGDEGATVPPKADIEAMLDSFVWEVRRDNDIGDQYTRQEVKNARAELLAAIRAAEPPSANTFLIFFHDQDRRPEVFHGDGAERGARERFRQISTSWNALLFGLIEDNCRHAETKVTGL